MAKDTLRRSLRAGARFVDLGCMQINYQFHRANFSSDDDIQQSLLSDADAVIGRHVASSDGAVSGYIQSVSFDNNSLLAHLDNGRSIPLSGGVVFS
jgi:hypothetical protein